MRAVDGCFDLDMVYLDDLSLCKWSSSLVKDCSCRLINIIFHRFKLRVNDFLLYFDVPKQFSTLWQYSYYQNGDVLSIYLNSALAIKHYLLNCSNVRHLYIDIYSKVCLEIKGKIRWKGNQKYKMRVNSELEGERKESIYNVLKKTNKCKFNFRLN